MHFPMLVFAEGNTEKQALDCVAKGLRAYKEVAFGWDDYSVEGRVAGRAADQGVFRAVEDPAETDRVVEHLRRYRLDRMYRARRLLVQLQGPIFDLEEGDPLLDQSHPSGQPFDDLAGHFMELLGRAITKSFCNEAGFFDAIDDIASPDFFYDRMKAEPERQWLVLLDLHN